MLIFTPKNYDMREKQKELLQRKHIHKERMMLKRKLRAEAKEKPKVKPKKKK